MFSPFGTPGRYLVTGSSRPMAPWSTSWRTTSAVRLLVTLPIRMWSSVLIGGAPSTVDEPNAVSQLPFPGTSTYTMAPGALSSPISAVIFGPRSAANAGAVAGAVDAVGAVVDAGGAEPAG